MNTPIPQRTQTQLDALDSEIDRLRIISQRALFRDASADDIRQAGEAARSLEIFTVRRQRIYYEATTTPEERAAHEAAVHRFMSEEYDPNLTDAQAKKISEKSLNEPEGQESNEP